MTPRVEGIDCNQNGIDDKVDIAGQRSRDCNSNGVPDECDLAPTHLRFDAPRRLQAASGPRESVRNVHFGDFNGDGRLDLVVEVLGLMNTGNRVLYFLGVGDGAFGVPETFSLPGGLGGAAAADLNGDGKLDLAIIGELAGGSTLRVFPGKGDGAFGESRTERLDGNAGEVLSADLDGDGDVDLAVFNGQSGGIWLCRNTGNGFFDLAVLRLETGRRIEMFLQSGDFDRDGDLDLLSPARPDRKGLILLRNRGDATFDEEPKLDGATFPGPPLVGDFDGDGDLDLVGPGADLFPNPGDGTFGPPVPTGLGPLPWFSARGAVAADLDGDGDLDLAFSGTAADEGEEVFLIARNDSRGTFPAVDVIPGGAPAVPVAALDLNQDGLTDLVSKESSGNLAVLLARGERGAASPDLNEDQTPDECEPDCDRDRLPDAWAVASGRAPDCNGNAIPDACDVQAEVRFKRGECIIQATHAFSSLVAADLNGDDRLDLAGLQDLESDANPDPAVFESARRLHVFMNLAADTFLEGPELDFDSPPNWIAAGDLEGDGSTELFGTAWLHGLVLALRNDGSGAFSLGSEFPALQYSIKVTALDLDGDGRVDLLVESGLNDEYRVAVLLNGGGVFFPPGTFPIPGRIAGIADLNGDGAPDLLTDYPAPTVSATWNDGKGAFLAHRELAPGSFLAAGDFDRDGDVDLALNDFAASRWQVVLNRGDGTFEQGRSIPRRASVAGLIVLDADGDGDLDLLGTASGSRFAVFPGDGRGGFAPAILVEEGPSARYGPVLPGDFDRDGRMDLAVLEQGECSLSIYFNRTGASRSDDLDRDGAPDECEGVHFRRGDSNDDGSIDLSDAIAILNRLFLGGGALSCEDAADANDDGGVNLSDPISIVSRLFLGGAPLPPPEGCGEDPTQDTLVCAKNC